MTRWTKRFAFAFLLAVAARAADTRLEIGKTVAAQLQAERFAAFTFELKAGAYAELVVEQISVDVVLRVVAPDKKVLYFLDSIPLGGSETVLVLAEQAGEYRLEAAPYSGSGDYSVRLAAVRTATDDDREICGLDAQVRKLLNADDPAGAAALEKLGEDLARRGVKRKAAEAHFFAAQLYPRVQQFEKGIAAHQRANALWKESGERAGQGAALINIGIGYRSLGQLQTAIGYFEQAAELRRQIHDREGEGACLNNIGVAYDSLSEYVRAISFYERALAIRREIGDKPGQAGTLNNLGGLYNSISQYDKATSLLEQSLGLHREIKNRAGEGMALHNLGVASASLSRYEKAIEYLEQARAIQVEVSGRPTGATINNLGAAYDSMSRYDKAIVYYEQSLALKRVLRDRVGEASTLSNLGAASASLSQYDKAVTYYEQALALAREFKDRAGEATTLNNLGVTYRSLARYEKSIECYELALKIRTEIGDRTGESGTLNNLGAVYDSLNQFEKALDFYQRSLAIKQAVKDRDGEAAVLNNIGAVSATLGDYAKATRYYQQALTIEREVKNRTAEAETLLNLGVAQDSLGQREQAARTYEQALAMLREVGRRGSEGAALNNLGAVYYAMGRYEEAGARLEQALVVLRESKNRATEAATLGNLMRVGKWRSQPRLAVFFGKQAVNLIQDIRFSLRSLGRDLQKSYIEGHKEIYRNLAGLLTEQGRLPEAQQVLNLLKDQEFFDYVRGDAKESAAGRADLTREESEWAARYRGESESLVARGAEMDELRGRLKQKPALLDDPVIKARLAELQQSLEAGNRAFQKYLGDLRQHFSAKADSTATAIDLREIEALKADLGQLKHGAVAIYTLVTSDRYRAILVTPRVIRAYESAITAAELNRKVLAFREAIQARADPLPAAQELYRVLIPAALAQDLEQAGAQTLMWSLDGPLRYAPLAALHDGRGYLIEKYRVAVFTPASQARLKDIPQANWRGVGFGVANATGFSPLPSVPGELLGIIRENAGETGEMDGRRLLDAQFTRQAMDRELLAGYPVVHVATHFAFKPGDETNSFLLLGDGSRLSLAELKSADTIFEGVDLLTLSACSTGLGDVARADGSEVEGFGVLAQRKGAKAVIASLWEVADQSTGILMREFYRVRQANRELTKIEALREAQLGLLRGAATSTTVGPSRGMTPIARAGAAAADYRHPYFWAAFFLMGNWL